MYPPNMKPIKGKPYTCLLVKATFDECWLWNMRHSYHNYKDINKLVLSDLVRGIPLLKYIKYHLRVACEMGNQSRKSHSSIMNTKMLSYSNYFKLTCMDHLQLKALVVISMYLLLLNIFSISIGLLS